MKSFAITLDDLLFLEAQINVPIIRAVKYLTDGTPIYGYTVPLGGFKDPITGQAVTTDPFTGKVLPPAGSVVELGIIGAPSSVAAASINPTTGKAYSTFDVFNTAWSLFLPPVVTANGTTVAGVGEPFGLRNVQGVFNNIALSSSAFWGAAFFAFARNTASDYDSYLQQRTGDAAFKAMTDVGSTLVSTLWSNLTQAQKAQVQGNTNYGVTIGADGSVNLSDRYANPFLTVYDYSPRMISQLVDSQAALDRIDAASGGTTITDSNLYQTKDISGSGALVAPKYDATGAVSPTGTYGYDASGTLVVGGTYFKESFQRNLNTLSGDPSLTGWNTLFGQFFSHGLDLIDKGGNTINGVSAKVYIPLSPTDPLYNSATGATSLSISRATVANPLAAGADGMFRTADDIQSPGKDGIYGTADDIIGPTDPTYINHTSPYIDQSQTYGSDDTTTNLLRQWVLNPVTNKYTPGMYLFDGTTLVNGWNRQNPDGTTTVTHDTLPTLNELRAYLRATGRDDLSWNDISNLRVRDANGKVLDIDPNTAGVQAAFTGHTLIADFLPRLDAAHMNAAGLPPIAGYTGNIGDYIDLNPAHGAAYGQPLAGLSTANLAIAQELLLRSIGDHYVAGDGRANENIGLTTVHHVWHEDHNWQVDNLINIIGQQQAADPTHSVAHAFQIKTNFLDSKGNYVYTAGGTDIAWDQEKMFQASVVIVQSEYQHIAIDQYARGMSPNIPLFVQYDSGVNSDVTLEYSQMAFRFGHSQLRETIDTLDPNGSLTAAVTRYALEQAFLNPAGFSTLGPTEIALGMTRQFSNEIDEIVTPALQQNLLGQAQDLAAINIARGRDLGLPTLNTLRRELSGGLTAQLNALNLKLAANPGDTVLRQTIDKTIALQAGLQPYSSWADFGSHIQHPEALVNFIAAYSFDGDLSKAQVLMKLGSGTLFSQLSATEQTLVNTGLGWTFTNDLGYGIKAGQFLNGGDMGYEAIDSWNGGLAETHVYLGELGPTFDAIFADQMTRLINGDRFYYFWRFQLGLPLFTDLNSAISTEQFKDVIERTTGATHLVGNVFFGADSYVELSETTPGATDSTSGIARDHKYGDLLAKSSRINYDGTTTSLLDAKGQHIGVASVGGSSEVLNGYVTQRITGKDAAGANIVENFILDVRPDLGKNPDGTPSSGLNAHEVISGTQFRDYIDAGDGDDTIYGGDGNDVLIGNAGADHIYGEGGDDLIYGGTLPDFLDGGIGNDEIHGGDDADVLIGGEGNDRLFGENFTDELHGGAGDDYLDGGLDADFIYGGTGQDIIVGGEGLDTTYGESGDDRMFGGAGPDQLFGGYGDDILNAGFGGQNQNVNVDEALGEFGFNIVSFSDIGNIALNHAADLNQENVNISNVTPFGQLWVNIQGIEGSSSNDTIIGYNGSGTVDATLIGNWLIGGGGNDTITTGSGDDVIVGDSVRLDALDGTYQRNADGTYKTDAFGAYILQNNGILDYAYGAAAAPSKHFLDLLKSASDFTFGDTVTLTSNGIIYTHQATPGIDTAIYAGDRKNFVVTEIFAPGSSTVLGYKIVDKTGIESTTKGDIVIGVENFLFNGKAYTSQNVAFNADGSIKVSGYAAANQPSNVAIFQLSANITDPQGISAAGAAYQWQYSINNGTTWQTVAGATASTFKPTNPAGAYLVPLGAVIRSIADYTDTRGTIEHVESLATQAMGRYVTLTGGANTAININNVAAIANNSSSTDYQDVLIGNSGNNTINAGGGNDYLEGGAGNDTLNGGTGADIMLGGIGNDTYVVDDIGDVVTENLNEGNSDLVQSSITYTLGANVEDLTLTGTANINGTGNTLSNTIIGNSGNNVLNGGGGADRLQGGLGDDTYVIDNAGVTVTETANQGTDTVLSSITYTLGNNVENLTLTGTANINATGNNSANVLYGNSGSNILDGSGGADSLFGGAGDDTYLVDNVGVLVTENANEGIDTVRASVTYTLTGNVENLTLTGNGNINGTGNAIANILTGNNGNNILNGFGGADTLAGGLGNDTYVIDNAGVTITENLNAGTDIVQSSISYLLGNNLENLTLTGTAAIDGTGNTLNNTLIGNTGSNALNGGAGNDTLTGGAGADQFVFSSGSAFTTAAFGNDTITDFSTLQGDKLVLSKSSFTALTSAAGGAISSGGTTGDFATFSGTNASAAGFTARIVYNQATGDLIYNQNGAAAGFGTGGTFANLTGRPTLAATDLLVRA